MPERIGRIDLAVCFTKGRWEVLPLVSRPAGFRTTARPTQLRPLMLTARLQHIISYVYTVVNG